MQLSTWSFGTTPGWLLLITESRRSFTTNHSVGWHCDAFSELKSLWGRNNAPPLCSKGKTETENVCQSTMVHHDILILLLIPSFSPLTPETGRRWDGSRQISPNSEEKQAPGYNVSFWWKTATRAGKQCLILSSEHLPVWPPNRLI